MTLLKTYAVKIDLPDEVLNVLKKINDFGYEAYIAGGAVRNFLLKKDIFDYDITTNATPDKIKEIFNKTFDTGIKHGTVTVVTKNYNIEVTTYRVDKEYKDHRRPENVEFTLSLLNDLARRDFTINALVYNPNEGIKDAFFGMEDIKNKIIRAVNDANIRFYEDALRILRGVRFSCTLGFDIEENTLNAMVKNADYLCDISVERIREEFTKIIFSEHLENILPLLNTDIFEKIMPDIKKLDNKDIEKIKNAPNDFCIKWALFIYYTNKPNYENILKKYKFSNEEKRKISFFIKNSDKNFDFDKVKLKYFMKDCVGYINEFCKFLNVIEKSFPERLYSKILKNNEPYTVKMLDVTGNDIKTIANNDKIIGKILDALLDFVIQNPKNNTKDTLLKKADEIIWKLNHTQK